MKLLSDIDFTKQQLLQPRLHNSSASPSSPTLGQMYLDTDDNKVYYWNGSAWVGLATQKDTWTYTLTGTVSTGTGTVRNYNRTGSGLTILGAWAAVGTAPTGATLIVDVNKNGTTIFTTQSARPTIAISGNSTTLSTPAVTTLADGDYITVDVDQVGSTVAGADLTVGVVVF